MSGRLEVEGLGLGNWMCCEVSNVLRLPAQVTGWEAEGDTFLHIGRKEEKQVLGEEHEFSYGYIEFEMLVRYLSGNIQKINGYIWICIQDRDNNLISVTYIQCVHVYGSYILYIFYV